MARREHITDRVVSPAGVKIERRRGRDLPGWRQPSWGRDVDADDRELRQRGEFLVRVREGASVFIGKRCEKDLFDTNEVLGSDALGLTRCLQQHLLGARSRFDGNVIVVAMADPSNSRYDDDSGRRGGCD